MLNLRVLLNPRLLREMAAKVEVRRKKLGIVLPALPRNVLVELQMNVEVLQGSWPNTR